jgi:hypothetical protein
MTISSINHQNFEFFGLVPKSPIHTGLICVKILEPNISSLGPYKYSIPPKNSARTLFLNEGNIFTGVSVLVASLQVRETRWELRAPSLGNLLIKQKDGHQIPFTIYFPLSKAYLGISFQADQM